ncbi:hypothetical protein ACHAW5_005808 [Stephanodiscus triporus]|uniref:Uncharacterized protein n=1 Tax=Stephanodiscus triporus TaxID=2934178 RepID=A0ABD3PXJ8_9STRA
MKCGIFVMIRDGKLRIFRRSSTRIIVTHGGTPRPRGDGSLSSYYSKRMGCTGTRRSSPIIEVYATSPRDWERTQFWGDHFLAALRDMIGEACRERDLPDCEFFPNKEGLSPAEGGTCPGRGAGGTVRILFDRTTGTRTRTWTCTMAHKFKTYAPIVSFYAASPTRFSDIPWPSSEGWEAAWAKGIIHGFVCLKHHSSTFLSIMYPYVGGLVFPGSFMHSKDAEGKVFKWSWDDGRIQAAFFRGGIAQNGDNCSACAGYETDLTLS